MSFNCILSFSIFYAHIIGWHWWQYAMSSKLIGTHFTSRVWMELNKVLCEAKWSKNNVQGHSPSLQLHIHGNVCVCSACTCGLLCSKDTVLHLQSHSTSDTLTPQTAVTIQQCVCTCASFGIHCSYKHREIHTTYIIINCNHIVDQRTQISITNTGLWEQQLIHYLNPH